MIVMTPHATEGEVTAVRERLETMGLHAVSYTHLTLPTNREV